MGTPSIAVITPVRNGMPFLQETVASIRAQDYQPLTVVMVDDGSTDGTLEYLNGLNGFCSKVLRCEGIGPAAARNAGIGASNSDLVAFLDADDLWPAGTLRMLVQALEENPSAGFAQGLIRNFRTMGDGAKEFFTHPYRFLNLGACLWRRSVLESVGLLDEGLRLCEDLDLLMRCWERDIRKVEVDKVALYYRRHEGNMTRGLSGAGFGTLAAYKRRIDRVRAGTYDPNAPRHTDHASYLGQGPTNQDGGRHAAR